LLRLLGGRLAQRVAHHAPVAVVVQRLARDADDPAGGPDLAGHETMEQGRQQLAYGQVASTAKDHQVERIERQGGWSHNTPQTR